MINTKFVPFSLPDEVRSTDYMYINKGKLHKYFSDFSAFEKEKERNIDFLMFNNVPHTPIIRKKLYNRKREFIGYVMDYIPNSMTFRQAIAKDIDFSKKESAIKDVYNTLKILHKYNLFLGDIHSDNFLIDEDGNGYIIDLEEMRGVGDEFKFKSLYLVKPNTDSFMINISSSYTDNVKLMISSISLLYDIDLEQYIQPKTHYMDLEKLYNDVISQLNDAKLDEYFIKLINKEEVGYFDDFYFNQFTLKK